MSDTEASRKAEIERVKEAADRVARRTSQNFVLDPVKLEQFTPLQTSRTEAPPNEE
jgi:hypothetical protein